jgi:hypothetical protein
MSSEIPEGPSLNRIDHIGAKHIADLDRFLHPRAGVVREDRRRDGTPPFIFLEVTGFLIEELAKMFARTHDSRYYDRAWKAACYLTRTDTVDDGPPSPYLNGLLRPRWYEEADATATISDPWFVYSFKSNNAFVFDNAICALGLLTLASVSLPERQDAHRTLVDRARVIGDELVKLWDASSHLPAGKRSMPAIVHAEDTTWSPGRENLRKWSRQFGPHHAKIAEALARLYVETGEERYRRVARELATRIAALQQHGGRFITTKANRTTQLHPHCYAAEGILEVAELLQDSWLREVGVKATEWALQLERGDGAIPQEWGPAGDESGTPSYARTDAVAQVLRLASRLITIGRLSEEQWDRVTRLAAHVAGQHTDQGFYYGYFENGDRADGVVSYWADAFAVDALNEFAKASLARETTLVVAAGGEGTRFYPMSDEERPKPFFRLGPYSLLQWTVLRFVDSGCVRPRHVFVVTGESSVREAQRQLSELGVPEDNVVGEGAVARGTPHALKLALQKECELLGPRRRVIFSTSDNLFEPEIRFQSALPQTLAAVGSGRDRGGFDIVSLAVPAAKPSSSLGNHFYRNEGALVLPVVRFEEKPPEELIKPDENVALDVGSFVAAREPLERSLDAALTNAALTEKEKKSLAIAVLEKGVGLYKGVCLLAGVRFVDIGDLRNVHRDLIGSRCERECGNVHLSSDSVRIKTLASFDNLVIANDTGRDNGHVTIVRVHGLAIMFNEHANAAVVMPIGSKTALEAIREALKAPQWKPYVGGGLAAAHAAPDEWAIGCQRCVIEPDHPGLVLLSACKDLRVRRTPNELQVTDTRLWPPEASLPIMDILKTTAHDPLLARHLTDVMLLTGFIKDRFCRRPETKEVLHYTAATHDGGGTLSEDGLAVERKLEGLLAPTGLDTKSLPPHVTTTLLEDLYGHAVDPDQVGYLERLNDSAASALKIIREGLFRDYAFRHELLYIVANHDDPTRFRTANMRLRPRPPLDREEIRRVFACLTFAEIWANVHEVWKQPLAPRLSERLPEDSARGLDVYCHFLAEADIPAGPYLEWVIEQFKRADSALCVFTAEELRLRSAYNRHDREPALASDDILRRWLNGTGVDELKPAIRQVFHTAEVNWRVLTMMPVHCRCLVDHRLENGSRLRELALAVWEIGQSKMHFLGSREEKFLTKLLEDLQPGTPE